MRMDEQGATGADLLNSLAEEELSKMLHQLGQEPQKRSAAIARRIVAERPIQSVAHYAKILRTERMGLVPKHLDPATLGFQALRMAVNREVDELVHALDLSCRVLRPGGRLVVVSYHSIEDRLVKKFVQISSPRKDPEGFTFNGAEDFIRPRPTEVAANPRSSSATLRTAVRSEHPFVARGEQLSALAIKRRG